ncbi:hypothetical protein Ait01nite_031710 [Actinoplanes italicus]|uniref:Uncharacterized protein n=1 Tax=Actinoplanes italicus TaxID=113567 RepID=A0A2T0KJX8_9ACTN|nr:hypothetical protein [Actinoplanes italicus]PRX23626.1 hypothetical protein CLV67_103375 [Actinoplanes italicus]GIE30126.1 hypothetical protein Ait01nite_031710 [Actinoplanes italicus]
MNATDQRALGAELIGIIRRDKARRSRRAALGKFFSRLVEVLLTGFMVALLRGWLFMLAVGAIHHHWMPQIPTLGYWWAVLIWALMPSLDIVKSERAK